MKKIITLITAVALIAPSAAQAGVTYTAPSRPSYSAPTTSYKAPSTSTSTRPTYSAPKPSIGGSGSGSSYKPPSTLPKVPANAPRSIPRYAYSDPHSTNYWGNPSSPYYWYFLSQYGHQDDDDDVSWGFILLIIGGIMAFCGVVFLGVRFFESRQY